MASKFYPNQAGTTNSTFDVGLNKLRLSSSNLTAQRTFTFADNSGTLALTTDITTQLQNVGWAYTGAGPLMTDMDDVNIVSGFYYVNGTTLGTFPLGTALNGTVIHKIYGAAGLQIYQSYNSDRIYWRRRSTTWQPWQEFANLASPAFTGTPTAPTAAQFDNDTSLATTAFVRGVGAQYASMVGASATATLTASVAGAVVIGTSNTAHTQTLPLTTTMPAGTTITFSNYSDGDMTLAIQGGDTLWATSNLPGNVAVMKKGDSAELMSNGAGIWRILGGSTAMLYSPLISNSSSVTGYLAKPVGGGVDVTLTEAEANNTIIQFTGALTANINVIMPQKSRQWIIYNSTTGAFTLTVKTSVSPGVVVKQSNTFPLFCNGSQIIRSRTDFDNIGNVTLTSLIATGNVAGGALYAGSSTAQAGGNGQLRYYKDTGAIAWTTGVEGSAGGVNYILYDNVGNVTRQTVAPDGTATFFVAGSQRAQINSTGLALNNNLTFNNTGQRITGDFSNGTAANRVIFQTTTANSTTEIGAIPNGTSTIAQYSVYNSPTPDNSSSTRLQVSSTSSNILADKYGTGAYLPLCLYTNGSERARLDVSGNLGLGTTSPTDTAAIAGRVLDVAGPIYARQSGTPANYITMGVVGGGTAALYSGFNGPLAISVNSTERMRISAAGNLFVGNIGGTPYNYHYIDRVGVTEGTSGNILCVSSEGGSMSTMFFKATGTGVSVTGSSIWTQKNISTNRSINAAGTINASGADYAEYMVKSDTCGLIEKGQVVGVNSDGKLTDKWSEAVSFLVKSTDPSYVGGDTWGSEEAIGMKLPTNTEADDYEELMMVFNAKSEEARAKVDRIAFCGQVPVNVVGAVVGQYVVPVQNGNDIGAVLVDEDDMTLKQYMKAVGVVQNILADGRANVRVKPV